MERARIDIHDARTLAISALQRAGLSALAAETTAAALVDADRRGHHSHGLSLLPLYLERIRHGGIAKQGEPVVRKCSDSTYVVDANAAIGPHAADIAASIAAREAREIGTCAVAVRRNNHVGMLAAYRGHFQSYGTIGLVMNISGPSVAPPGASKAVIGSNAMCLIVPRQAHREPFCVDLGTGTVAAGKIRQAASDNLSLPQGYLLDRSGNPTTDPSMLDRGGAIPVFGGHKGLAVHVMIELLAGAVAGNTLSLFVNKQRKDLSKPMNCSQLFIGLSPGLFGGMALDEAIERLRTAIRESYEDGAPQIYFPDQMEASRMDAAEEGGLSLSSEIVALLRSGGLADV